MKIRSTRPVFVIAALSASAVLGAAMAHARSPQVPQQQERPAQQQTPTTDQQRQTQRDNINRADPTQNGPAAGRDNDSRGNQTGQTGVAGQAVQNQAHNQADTQFIAEALASGRSEIATARLAQERASHEDIEAFARDLERDHTQLNARLEALQRSGAGNTSTAAQTGSMLQTGATAQTGAAARTGATGTISQTGMEGHSGEAGTAGSNAKTPGQPGTTGAMGEGTATAHAGKGRELQELSGKSGEDFDKAFLSMQVRHHQESIRKFETAAKRSGGTSSADGANSAASVAREALPVLRRHAARAQELSQQLGSS